MSSADNRGNNVQSQARTQAQPQTQPQTQTQPPAISGFGRRPPSERFAEVEHAQDALSTLRRMAGYLAHEKALLAAMFVVVVLGAGCGVIAPALQSRAIDLIAVSAYGEVPLMAGLMLVAYLAYGVCQMLQRIVSAYLSQHMVGRLRQDLFSKVIDLPVSYLDRHSRGDVMSRMTNDVDNISTTVSQSLPTLISGVLTIGFTLAAMLWYSWQLTILCMLAVLLTLVATKLLSGKVRKYSRDRQAYLGELNGSVEEVISNMHTVVAYNHQAAAYQQFETTSDALTKAGIRTNAYSGVMGPVMNCISNLDFIIVAAFGGLFATQGMISVGVISAFIVYAKQFSRPINEIAQVYGELQTAVAGAERAFEIMDQTGEDMAGEELVLAAEIDGGGAGTARSTAVNVGGRVSFEHVRFSYDHNPNTPAVLSDFTLEVPAGKKIALVGATGSGKTTVVSLLERFYDIDGGVIRVGDQDIVRVARPSLRSHIAIVLQDAVLFSDTVRANLLYARQDATEQDLWQALELSRAADMVRALPQGLDTMLTGAGEELSQGQRQLLAIARAFVADPQILILDEATSNVDTRTEQAVQDAMQRVMQNRTSIVIAHRLSTIRDADMIVVMDHGSIVESGTHTQLLAAGGTYKRLYETQFAGRDT